MNPSAATRYCCTFSIIWPQELSCILTFPKNKAADTVEGGAHDKRFKHVGDNVNGVNALYAGKQNFQKGKIDFG
jgi:hypothetical protein